MQPKFIFGLVSSRQFTRLMLRMRSAFRHVVLYDNFASIQGLHFFHTFRYWYCEWISFDSAELPSDTRSLNMSAGWQVQEMMKNWNMVYVSKVMFDYGIQNMGKIWILGILFAIHLFSSVLSAAQKSYLGFWNA